jgi:hypothetical protein
VLSVVKTICGLMRIKGGLLAMTTMDEHSRVGKRCHSAPS